MGQHHDKQTSPPETGRKERNLATTPPNPDVRRKEKTPVNKDSVPQLPNHQGKKNASRGTISDDTNSKSEKLSMVKSVKPIIGELQLKHNINARFDANVKSNSQPTVKSTPRNSSAEMLERWSSPSNPYIDTSQDPFCDTSSVSDTCIPDDNVNVIDESIKENEPVENSFDKAMPVVDNGISEEQKNTNTSEENAVWRSPSNPYVGPADAAEFNSVSELSVKTALTSSKPDLVKEAQTQSFILHSYPDINATTSAIPSIQRWKRKKKYSFTSTATIDSTDEILGKTDLSTPSIFHTGPVNSSTIFNPSLTVDSDSTIASSLSTSAPGVVKWKRKKKNVGLSSSSVDRRSEASQNTLSSASTGSDISTTRVNTLENTTHNQNIDEDPQAQVQESSTLEITRFKRKIKYTKSGVLVTGKNTHSVSFANATPASSSAPRVTNVGISSLTTNDSSEEDKLKTDSDATRDNVSLKAVLSSDIKKAEEDIWLGSSGLMLNAKLDLEQMEKNLETSFTSSILSKHDPLLRASKSIAVGTDEKKSSYGDIDTPKEPYFNTSSTADFHTMQNERQLHSHSDRAVNATESLHSSISSLQDTDPQQAKSNITTISDPGISKKKVVTFITPSTSKNGTKKESTTKNTIQEKSTSTASLASDMSTNTHEQNLSSSSLSETENGLVLWRSPSNPYI